MYNQKALLISALMISQAVCGSIAASGQEVESAKVSQAPGWEVLREALRQRTDRERAGLHGPVRSVLVERDSILRRKRQAETQYDLRGNVLEENKYHFGGDPDSEVRAYNEEGYMVELLSYRQGVLGYKKTYSYDSGGKLSEVRYSNDDGIYRKESYRYDPTSNIVDIHTSGDRDEKRKCQYSVVASGVEVVCMELDGELLSKMAYDRLGNVTENLFDRKVFGKLAFDIKDEFTFDASSNMIEERQYTKERGVGAPWKRQKTIRKMYDKQGHALEETYYSEQEIIQQKIRYSYELDNHGNWTKQTKSGWWINNGKREESLPEVLYRVITYY